MATPPASYRNALSNYLRKHAFVPRYGTEQALSLVTDDGVRLSGARLTGPSDAPGTVVLVHGFSQSSRVPRIHAFAHLLAARMHVIVPDLRGHGASGGLSSMGPREPLDVKAAVEAADPALPVVTVGISLGGPQSCSTGGRSGAWPGSWPSAPPPGGVPGTPPPPSGSSATP